MFLYKLVNVIESLDSILSNKLIFALQTKNCLILLVIAVISL